MAVKHTYTNNAVMVVEETRTNAAVGRLLYKTMERVSEHGPYTIVLDGPLPPSVKVGSVAVFERCSFGLTSRSMSCFGPVTVVANSTHPTTFAAARAYVRTVPVHHAGKSPSQVSVLVDPDSTEVVPHAEFRDRAIEALRQNLVHPWMPGKSGLMVRVIDPSGMKVGVRTFEAYVGFDERLGRDLHREEAIYRLIHAPRTADGFLFEEALRNGEATFEITRCCAYVANPSLSTTPGLSLVDACAYVDDAGAVEHGYVRADVVATRGTEAGSTWEMAFASSVTHDGRIYGLGEYLGRGLSEDDIASAESRSVWFGASNERARGSEPTEPAEVTRDLRDVEKALVDALVAVRAATPQSIADARAFLTTADEALADLQAESGPSMGH